MKNNYILKPHVTYVQVQSNWMGHKVLRYVCSVCGKFWDDRPPTPAQKCKGH